MARLINPRFVIRHHNHQIHPRPLVQQPTQRRGAVGAAAANRRQLLRVVHNRLARIKLHVDHIAFKRQHAGLRMITQHGGGDQPGNVHAADLTGRPLR